MLVTSFGPNDLQKYLSNKGNVIIYDKTKDAADRGFDRSWSTYIRRAPFTENSVTDSQEEVKKYLTTEEAIFNDGRSPGRRHGNFSGNGESKAQRTRPGRPFRPALLARAYEGIAKTEYEKKSLEKYKGMVAQLDADTEKLKDLRRQIHAKTFVAGQVDRVGALKLRQEADALEKQIAKADKTLLNMERSAALKNVLEAEKKEAQRKQAEKIKGQMLLPFADPPASHAAYPDTHREWTRL